MQKAALMAAELHLAPPPATPRESTPDDAVIAKVLKGDRDAFAIIVERYAAPLYRTAWRVTRHEQTSEDIVQETFARAWKQLRKFDTTRPLRPWLSRIALNLAISHIRSAAQVVSLPHADHENLPEPSPGPRRAAELSETRGHLKHAVSTLPREMKLCVTLFYDEDMSIAAIAEATGAREGTVRVTLHRARNRLRRILFGNRQNGENP